MKCWNCGTELNTSDKISFRATCDKCSFYLHCCKNCRNYKPGLPNDCAVPGTEYIADRAANNYCEDFEPLGIGPSSKADPKEAERRLFGDNSSQKKDPDSPKSHFESLFRDD